MVVMKYGIFLIHFLDMMIFFFGKYDNNHKISYAASFGSAKTTNIDIFLKDELKNLLNKFSFLSVRDENSWNILKSEFNLNSEIVLDPTFLIEDYSDLSDAKNELVPKILASFPVKLELSAE